MPVIPYGRQWVDEHDIAAVVASLKSDFLTQGPQVELFENEIAEICGADFTLATNSATSALHIAYLALGMKPGKLVWTTPNTFVATSNTALLCGAGIDFVDIDPRTYNLDPEALAAKLDHAQRNGLPMPDVVTFIDFAGQPCAIERMRELASRYGFRTLEDASHSIGATWRNESVGCGRHADITVFSFHPVKIVTTGEGGMAATSDPDLARAMRLYHTHGVTRDPNLIEDRSQGMWYYEQVELGLNYRMTDIQAALGRSQLQRLDEFLARRRAIAARYDSELKGLPLRTPWQDPDGLSSFHLYPIVFDVERLRGGRRAAFDLLRSRGIGVQVHYIPVHTQPYYRRHCGTAWGQCPQAERYYRGAVSLPMFAALTDDQQTHVIEILCDVCADLAA